jgi:hypothetical protein
MFHMTSTRVYWHAKKMRKPEIAFPSVKGWNESEDGMIVSGVSEFVDIFDGIGFFGSVSPTAYRLLAEDNRSVWHDLLVHGILQFDEETTTYEFFTQHPPILHMGLCDTALVNGVLNITFMSVDPTFAIPQSVLWKDDATFVLGVNLLSSHFCGDFLAKQEQTTAGHLAATPDALRLAVLRFPVLPLLIAFATAIMVFWCLEGIGDAFYFCFGSLSFVDFSMVMDNHVLTHILAGVFRTDERDLSIFSPLINALPRFASRVVFQLQTHPEHRRDNRSRRRDTEDLRGKQVRRHRKGHL